MNDGKDPLSRKQSTDDFPPNTEHITNEHKDIHEQMIEQNIVQVHTHFLSTLEII